jgi:hypothetical protein
LVFPTGLAPKAHDKDALYGVKAALDICHAFVRVVGIFSIGVTTGLVSINGVGNPVRTEYAVVSSTHHIEREKFMK